MQYFILLTLTLAVIAVNGQEEARCPHTAEEMCEKDSSCTFTCKYHCCKADKNVFGSVTYLANSSICVSALHDLRFPPDERKRVVEIKRFSRENCLLEGSVRYGFSSFNFPSESPCEVFEFVGSRVSENISDVVSMHSDYLYKENGTHTQVCISEDTSPKIKFGVYSDWQNCKFDKEDEKNQSKETKEYKIVWNNTEKAGFQCFESSKALSIITSIAFSEDAYFIPNSLTVTVNKGEDVVLSMVEQFPGLGNDTIWKKDYKELFVKPTDTVSKTELSMKEVLEGSSGLYRLSYKDRETEKPGFVLLIIRACRKDQYGVNCSKTCPSCLHGGICHDITGECICAPGFNGSTCENACKAGYVGKKCNIKCGGNHVNETQLCRGLLICLPSPYGCSCASGFTGLDCDKECEDHFYGAGCRQQHKHVHFKNGSCSRFNDSCDCQNGWHGDLCSESYPVLKNPPKRVNVTENGIVLSFSKWSNVNDRGSGTPAFYQVVFKEIGEESWKFGISIPANKTLETYQVPLRSLKPATEYEVGVIVIDESRNKQEINISVIKVETLCDAPSAPPSDIKLYPKEDDQCIFVHWQSPLKENWNCWKISFSVKVRNSCTNDTKKCIKKDNSTCFFDSEPFVMWIVEVCALSDGNKENCSKPYNITTEEINPPPVRVEIEKSETSVSLTWMQPSFANQLQHYVIRHVNMGTNIANSTEILTQDAACDSDKKKFHCYTIKNMIPGHRYKFEIEAFYAYSKKGHIIASFGVSLGKSSVAVSVFLGVFLPVLLILCIIALILYMRRRKKRKSTLRVKFLPSKIESEFAACNEALDEMDIIETESMGEEISNPISLEILPEYVKQGIQNTKIRKEFISIPAGQIYPCSVAKLVENKSKNRYGNILPYDHSRVVLEIIDEDPSSNYIHASYIHGYNKVKKYIATQGPLRNTVTDFWRMVWDEGSCKILMITNVMENGRYKCEKYWTEDSHTFGDINISLEGSKSYADYIVRTYKVSKGNNSREVKQFHFTTWPDHGAPSNPTPFGNYLKKTRCYKPDFDAPIIVHCSAGIGRTGTTILLDSMIDMALQEKQVDLVSHLCSMRKQRMNIVENFDQYVFVYCALVEILCYEDTHIKPSDFKKEFERLKTIDKDSEMTFIDKQFQVLSQLTAELMYKDLLGAYQEENQSKNRSMMILPPDRARPFVSRDFSGYINAVYVDSFTVKNAYIATQYPLPDTIQDFWSMVYEQKSKIVILLQEIDSSNEEVPHLWLPDGVLKCGDLEITWQCDASKNEMTVVNIIISHKDGGIREPLSVNIVILEQWANDSNLPTDASIILSTIHKINSLNSESPSIITVVCIDGVTACGVLCACLYVCDHFKDEQEIDIFHATKCIRTNRPHFISNLAQYEFIFEVISSYLESSKD